MRRSLRVLGGVPALGGLVAAGAFGALALAATPAAAQSTRPPVVHLQHDRSVAPAEPVRLAVTRLWGARPVTVDWGDGTVSRARSRCSRAQATAHPRRCSETLAHAYGTSGAFRIVVKRAPRADYRATVTVGDQAADWQSQMLAAANALRSQAGAEPLILCAPLVDAAQDYAELMATTGHYGHVGPDGSQPWERMTEHGYQWRSAAENIAGGFDSVPEVMEAWRNSPGHLHNLLDPDYRHVGFGQAAKDGSKYRIYWVQDFGAGGSCGA